MGTLQYGSSLTEICISDHLLAHLKAVMVTRMRRSESFTLSWVDREGGAEKHSTVWVNPAIPLRFTFETVVPPPLDHELLEDLMTSSYQATGIVLPAEAAHREPEVPR